MGISDRPEISPLTLSKFQWIDKLVFPLKSSENQFLSDDSGGIEYNEFA